MDNKEQGQAFEFFKEVYRLAKKNFYAVKYGVDPVSHQPVLNLILKSWPETERLIKGVPGAIYSGFITEQEAIDYLGTEDPLKNKSERNYPLDGLHCYVDGSFNENLNNYSFALVCVQNGEVLDVDYGLGTNPKAVSMRQIGGELLGAIKALLYAEKTRAKEVVIFHDYKGVAYHATGYWKRDNAFSEDYYNWMQNFFRKFPDIKVHFVKVDAHTGDEFNEIADGLAKKALGIEPNKVFFKILEKHQFVF